jgi:hypothetical protein
METTTYRCYNCKEDKDERAFQLVPAMNGKRYRRSICRPCTYLRYGKYTKTRVPISKIRPFLDELIHHCGSERAAARTMGIPPQQLRAWLGKQKRYYRGRHSTQIRMSKASAALVLSTLREVRDA